MADSCLIWESWWPVKCYKGSLLTLPWSMHKLTASMSYPLADSPSSCVMYSSPSVSFILPLGDSMTLGSPPFLW